ncbi:metal-dependent hydrolase [Salinigranum sp.]|uniref:metal-dependent hydrolase n=1 Tax=Salinigranum sp. TaxID=1966351 RepID=UPI003568272B
MRFEGSDTVRAIRYHRYHPVMWPWGHLAVGYLSYTVAVRLFRGRRERAALLALVVGTQFPDVVDKPLAWVGFLPYGRSLAHSLLVLVPLCLVVVVVARRRTRTRTGTAFALGALTHTLTDAWHGIVTLDPGRLSFLLWPYLPSPDDGGVGTPGGHADRLASEVDTSHAGAGGLVDVVQSEPVGQLLLLAVAVVVWIAEGTPGLPGRGR